MISDQPKTCLPCNSFLRAMCIAALLFAITSRLSQAETIPFGFDPLEVMNVEFRSNMLSAGDVNGDGKHDLVIVDNSHSRIDIFLQRDPNAKIPKKNATNATDDVNQIPDARRFRHVKLPVKRAIQGLLLGDFVGDDTTDIAWIASPTELVIASHSEGEEWSEVVRQRLPAVSGSTLSLKTIDIGNDQKTDIVVLGEKKTLIIRQSNEDQFTATSMTNTSQKAASLNVADINGDGLDDLTYTNADDSDRAFCVRLQRTDGGFRAEERMAMRTPHDVCLTDFDGDQMMEVVSVDSRNYRVAVQKPVFDAKKVTAAVVSGAPNFNLTHFGIETAGSSRDRMVAIGDVDANGLDDVLVNSPDAPHLQLYLQSPESGLDTGQKFATLVDVQQIAIEKRNDNQPPAVVVLSEREKTLAISRYEDGRLQFPTPFEVKGIAKTFNFADIDGDGVSELVVIADIRGETHLAGHNLALEIYKRDKEGELKVISPNKDGYTGQIKTKSSSVTPQSIVALDLNSDEDLDLLVSLGKGRPPIVILNNGPGKFSVPEEASGLKLTELDRNRLFVSPRDPSFVLVAQPQFVRQIQFSPKNEWTVSDQFNALEPRSSIACVSALDLDGDDVDEIVQVDTGLKVLNILRREGSLYVPWKRIESGALSYRSIHTADLNGDGRKDMLLFSGDRFSVVSNGGSAASLRTIAGYETALEKRAFTRVLAGDLNGDKQVDLTLVDTRSGTIEIIDAAGDDNALARRINWRIYESKSFRKTSGGGTQPREVVIADVTDDQLDDLILLAHDRILIYPQEALPSDDQ